MSTYVCVCVRPCLCTCIGVHACGGQMCVCVSSLSVHLYWCICLWRPDFNVTHSPSYILKQSLSKTEISWFG